MKESNILKGFEYAKERYAELGVDVEKAIAKADAIPVSMHCWQGDDVIGFDGTGELTGGIATTGNYPGRARTPEELRADAEVAIKLIPGAKKFNLHACYAEKNGKKIDRDAYTVDEFINWIEWAKGLGMGLDFNPTYFSHPMMDGDFSLSSADPAKARFWIEHAKRCREIGAKMGEMTGQPCVVNHWMPDGYKDVPADTAAPRRRMTEALDEVFAQKFDKNHLVDVVESKLFGMGVESYTVASHEYSLGYAISRGIGYCLDSGHFHPTEYISAKISAVMEFVDQVLLHVSRGVRWDSDHAVAWDDELQRIMDEIIHNGFENRVFIGLDFFDASINRIACWAIGTRNTRKALLAAALNPCHIARKAEADRDLTGRLAMIEEAKSLPFAPVWDYYCLKAGVPVGEDWLEVMRSYERDVLANR